MRRAVIPRFMSKKVAEKSKLVDVCFCRGDVIQGPGLVFCSCCEDEIDLKI